MRLSIEIEKDLEWRETELASFRRLIADSTLSTNQRSSLLRAAWALLYAHYEGFVKFCLEVYLEEVADAVDCCRSLPRELRNNSLEKHVNQIRSLPLAEAIDAICTDMPSRLAARPEFPPVNTKSNLWPNVLRELTARSALRLKTVEEHDAMLKALVSRRNDIAHGKQQFIQSVSDYMRYEKAVKEVIYELALSAIETIETMRARE